MTEKSAAFDIGRVGHADLVAPAGDWAELFEDGAVAAEAGADHRKRIAEALQKDVPERIDEREVVIAVLEADAGVDAVIAIERIADDAHHAGLAIELVALEEILRAAGEERVKRAVVEESEAPVGAMLQIEVEEIEIRE